MSDRLTDLEVHVTKLEDDVARLKAPDAARNSALEEAAKVAKGAKLGTKEAPVLTRESKAWDDALDVATERILKLREKPNG